MHITAEKRIIVRNIMKEVAQMRILEISILFILLWLVVCMPELNNALESADASLRIAILHW